MSTTPDIWIAFARTFSVLFVVLALLILVFYLVKRLSTASGGNKKGNYIQVLSMHHLSPKEKLVLLNVLGETILIGVTPNQISKLKSIDTDMEFSSSANEKGGAFSDFLGNSLKRSLNFGQSPKKGQQV